MSITEIFAKNLRGHAYLAARNLKPMVRVGNVVPQSHPDCDYCNAQEKKAAVLRILSHREPAKPVTKKANVTKLRGK